MPRFIVPYSRVCAYPEKHPTSCNVDHERMALEARIIRYTLRALKLAGWIPVSVFDGDENVMAATEDAVLTAVFSVDVSTVRLRSTTRNRRTFFHVVLGNGVDVVGSDFCRFGASIDETMMAVCQKVATW